MVRGNRYGFHIALDFMESLYPSFFATAKINLGYVGLGSSRSLGGDCVHNNDMTYGIDGKM